MNELVGDRNVSQGNSVELQALCDLRKPSCIPRVGGKKRDTRNETERVSEYFKACTTLVSGVDRLGSETDLPNAFLVRPYAFFWFYDISTHTWFSKEILRAGRTGHMIKLFTTFFFYGR